MDNKNKIILITGSSNGIGAGIAKHFGEIGYTVVVTYNSNKKDGESVVESIKDKGGDAILYQLDVTDENSAKKLFNDLTQKYKKLDILVNNAAVDFPCPIETVTFEGWKEITRTKIDGNFLCTKYALPLLKESNNPNVIIIMSSMYEKVDPEDSAYCVGTAGTVAFLKSMALALTKYGIRTNGIGPSETQTNSKYWKLMGNKELWDDIAKKNPMGRLCTPKDVAQAVQTIVDDPSKFLNGNILYVTGGNHLR